jgi:hypothetical protein
MPMSFAAQTGQMALELSGCKESVNAFPNPPVLKGVCDVASRNSTRKQKIRPKILVLICRCFMKLMGKTCSTGL